jgi:putative endonuclease
MKDYYGYILRCRDGKYYIGITNDITGRVSQHQVGTDPKAYTYSRRPVELVYNTIFGDIWEAIDWEKRVKRWSRKKKEAMISREWEKLPELSLGTTARQVRQMIDDVRKQLTHYFTTYLADSMSS